MKLYPDDIKRCWDMGHYTPMGYLNFLLKLYCPVGDTWRIENISEFCQHWNFPEYKFKQARAALIARGRLVETMTDCLELTALDPDGAEAPHPAKTLAIHMPPTGTSDWATWYDEARRRGLVLASQRQGETTLVCLVDERWVPYEQLRSQSWEELEAQLQPMMVDAVASATELTPEQQKILAAMSRLTGG